ncbi:MAG: helix-turn-helix transcriptional regulator [Deltaproteobacteria bacterium]|nr:helix-turn-helix transcriptional regulator [Deltaproteobacteria bacterium]
MAIHKWKELRDSQLSPEAIARIEKAAAEEVLAINIRALRELLGKTQEEMAKATAMSQSEISRLEHRTDYLVSTLRKCVEALGGELEIRANFGAKSIRLAA